MSVQLILYPQNTSGQYNQISINPNEFVVNGINFTGLGSASSRDSAAANIYTDVLTNAPPSIINTWNRFRSTTGGSPALPTVSSGNAVFNSIAVANTSGIYQRLSNLNVGQSYTVNLTLSTTSSGFVYIGIFNGSTQLANQPFAASSSNISYNFIANATDNTLVISYANSVATNIEISSISVIPQSSSPSGNITFLDNGQVICDLYENEDIPLTLSIDDFKNAAEMVQSYSKAFSLPATKRNNQIFNNIFEITRNDDGIIFNPYLQTKCVLKQDGFLIFEGYLRLIDVQDKLGEISYNVNLYSEVIALADYLEDRTFSDLNFAELTHDYNKTNIKTSWTTGVTYSQSGTSGFRAANTIKYPFVNWEGSILLANGSTGSNATIGNPELTSLEQAFRPFINIRYLIDRIFQNTPFSFTSEFFDEADFKKLYMDFNWGSDNNPTNENDSTYSTYYTFGFGDGSAVNYATSSYDVMNLSTNIPFIGGLTPPNYNDSTNVLTSTVDNETYIIDYIYSIENTDTVARQIECRWLYNAVEINYSGVQTIPAGGTFSYSGTFTKVMINAGDTLKAQFKTNAGTASKVRQDQTTLLAGYGAYVRWQTGMLNLTSNILLQTLRGDLGQWEFLKGIMTMFNLVSIPDKSDPNNILIEPYSDVFIKTTKGTSLSDRSISHDWTEKIDVSEMQLKPLTDLNKKTILKFVEDDDDYAFTTYKNAVGGHLYGSKLFDASGFTILEGTEEIIADPFAATVPRPLDTQFPNFIVPMIYSYNADDGTSSGFENSPRIMYDNGVKGSGTTYYIPSQNGLSSENQPDFLQFSHLSTIPTAQGTLDFHFGECQLIQPIGSPVNTNLFNLYWMPYFAELYNANTRTMTLKVNLTAGDISTFNLYDTVFIKNREFRVNKIEYKPNDLATVEFILIP